MSSEYIRDMLSTTSHWKEHLLIVPELLRENLYEWGKHVRESRGTAHELPTYFTLPRLRRIARQCLAALRFVHSLGLIHCDVKVGWFAIGQCVAEKEQRRREEGKKKEWLPSTTKKSPLRALARRRADYLHCGDVKPENIVIKSYSRAEVGG